MNGKLDLGRCRFRLLTSGWPSNPGARFDGDDEYSGDGGKGDILLCKREMMLVLDCGEEDIGVVSIFKLKGLFCGANLGFALPKGKAKAVRFVRVLNGLIMSMLLADSGSPGPKERSKLGLCVVDGANGVLAVSVTDNGAGASP